MYKGAIAPFSSIFGGDLLRSHDIIRIFLAVEPMKELQRSGWITAGLSSSLGESVGSHSWGVSLIALVLTETLTSEGATLDTTKILTMSIIHDLPEVKTSDIPKSAIIMGGDKFESGKEDAEREAMKSFRELLKSQGHKFYSLWEEYQDGKSEEARIVRAADILDMLVHAIKLENSGVIPDTLDSFFVSSKNRVDSLNIPIVTEIYNELLRMHGESKMRSNQDRIEI